MSTPETMEDLRASVQKLISETPEEQLPTLARVLTQAKADCEVRLQAALVRRAYVPAADDEQMLTIKQAAALAGMSPSWIKNMVATARLAAITMPGTTTGREVVRQREGRSVRIRRRDLLALFAAAERNVA